MNDPAHLTVSKVHVENFQRIELVDLALGDGLTILSGENRAGKSSVLDWLRQLFEGKGSRGTMPIHEGADAAKGFAVLDADGKPAFTVELEIRQGKSDRLVVRDAEGNPTGHGQDWLKGLIGRGLAFDCAEFETPPGAKTAAARDKLRLEMLLRVAPLGIDLASVAEQRAELYAKRTQANRDVETHMAKLLVLKKADVPAVVDLAAKRLARDAANAVKNSIDAAVARIKQVDKDIEEIKAKYKKLTDERALLVPAASLEMPALASMDLTISAGEASNVERERILAANEKYDEAQKSLAHSKKLSDGCTESIERLDKEKADALAAAKFPVPGLSVSEAAVFYNSKPYEVASDAERLEIAFAICAADKPALSLALIDVGEVFDTKAVARIGEIAQRLGVQVLLARRSPDVANRVEIVDGRTV